MLTLAPVHFIPKAYVVTAKILGGFGFVCTMFIAALDAIVWTFINGMVETVCFCFGPGMYIYFNKINTNAKILKI